MDKNETKRIEENITLLGDKLSEFLYATDYFGLPEEVADNAEIKRIVAKAHDLYEEITKGDYLG